MTLKTPLPSKVLPGANNNTERINQLIDVVAELRKVVEGSPETECVNDEIDFEPEVNYELKRRLLNEMRDNSFREHSLSKRRMMLEDVEAIINRLIP